METLIAQGRASINGRNAKPGDRAAPGDVVGLDRRRFNVVLKRPEHRSLIYHKPEGVVTTRRDPQGRPTVFDELPALEEGRWIAVGRLDLNTSGVLLLTTDGELAHRMMHPSGKIDREYLCRIRGAVSEEQIQRLLDGVELEDGPARFTDLVPGEVTAGHAWYTVVIMEGRHREVRRMWEAVGATVARLKRVRYGPVFLPPDLQAGRFQELNAADHRILREDVGLPSAAVEPGLEPA